MDLISELTVTGTDNRGTDEVPYGFVYFSDGKRVVYSGTDVHEGTGGWEPVTEEHRELAREYLSPQES